MIPEEYKKYENTATVAAVNWKGEWGNKAANLEKIKAKVREATEAGANIVCFPELALSGYECGEEARREQKPCFMHVEAAETVPGPSTMEVAKLAKELDTYVIFGMPERDAENPDIGYVSAAIVGPEGILGSYRKLHLASPPRWTEYYCFRPGNELPIFETRYGPIGIQICADFWIYPELCRILCFKGARIIFNPVGSAATPGRIDQMTWMTAGRGQENFVYVVSVNHVGKERTLNYYGHSAISGPTPPRTCQILAQGGSDEEIVYATFNFKALHLARQLSPVKEKGNWKLIAREYQKLAESAG
ncbi:carbon-nitrogen hydrolase family protein [Chloroflexota bacterium]